MSLKKSWSPKQKNFFQVQSKRLPASFEPLNSSLLLSVPELRMRNTTCDPVVLAQESSKSVGRQSVKFFFVGDVITEIGVGLFGRGYLTISPKCKREVFCPSFQWKLGLNSSLLSLWLVFLGFWFKSYGQNI